jgi:ammonium transporter, Amt family
VLCYAELLFRVSKGLDESCDAWAVLGTGVLWGAIAMGIFAGMYGYEGLLYGNTLQFVAQIIAAGVAVFMLLQ